MNHAWEAVLLAEHNNRDRDSLRFVEADGASPYIEVSVTDLNAGEPEGDRVEINPLYRLGDVFGRLFDRNTDQMAQGAFFRCMHALHRAARPAGRSVAGGLPLQPAVG